MRDNTAALVRREVRHQAQAQEEMMIRSHSVYEFGRDKGAIGVPRSIPTCFMKFSTSALICEKFTG